MNNPVLPRRQVLKSLGALALATVGGRAGAQAAQAAQGTTGTQLILLGTKGGPRVGGDRSNPATALLIDGVPYVVDCGQGVARQLVSAGIALNNVHKVFITHMHSDHNLELGGLLYDAWVTGLNKPIDVYGPPTVDTMVTAFFESMKFDIDTRIADEARPDLRRMVQTHVYDKSGLVMQNDQVKVTAARNLHPPIHDSFALRFDTKDRVIVISGDTSRADAVVELAKGADVLVHEAMYLPGVDALVKRVPNAATMREHLMASHTSTEDVGRVAAAAGVKTLVLSHLVPGDMPGITDEMWAEGARKHFKGQIIVGKDLMVL